LQAAKKLHRICAKSTGRIPHRDILIVRVKMGARMNHGTEHKSAKFTDSISDWVWQARYRRHDSGIAESDISTTWDRVAYALAAKEESGYRAEWQKRFRDVLSDFVFLPGGRILANAGVHGESLFNCFVMDSPRDKVETIFKALQESMQTIDAGGGIGCDFSTIPPIYRSNRSVDNSAHASSGPVAFMQVWDSACAATSDNGVRPGAMMATLRDDHPDIEAFIDAKRVSGALQHFNLSVLVSDALMRAVETDALWPLMFPVSDQAQSADVEICERQWSGSNAKVPCAVNRRIRARPLWERLMRAAYDAAEPGVIFIDRVRKMNNLAYREQISATNPCGEIPLPAFGACNLGSLNLTKFVRAAFTPNAHLDYSGIASATVIAVRMLDNVYDVSAFPLGQQAEVAMQSRRIGLGVTGLASALIMLGLRYGDEASLQTATKIMCLISHSAYRASVILARERGSFPAFSLERYCAGGFVSTLPHDIHALISKYGIRGSHLTAVAPAGSISLLAGNVSSGIEPVFAFSTKRDVRTPEGHVRSFAVEDYASKLFHQLHGPKAKRIAAFVEAYDVDPVYQLNMQAHVQAHVDNAVSKTVNVPADFSFDSFRNLYKQAHSLGLKGCTVFRPNETTRSALSTCDESVC
jgi:ribonucleoside-diphosphate reductase alpha chain